MYQLTHWFGVVSTPMPVRLYRKMTASMMPVVMMKPNTIRASKIDRISVMVFTYSKIGRSASESGFQ